MRKLNDIQAMRKMLGEKKICFIMPNTITQGAITNYFLNLTEVPRTVIILTLIYGSFFPLNINLYLTETSGFRYIYKNGIVGKIMIQRVVPQGMIKCLKKNRKIIGMKMNILNVYKLITFFLHLDTFHKSFAVVLFFII